MFRSRTNSRHQLRVRSRSQNRVMYPHFEALEGRRLLTYTVNDNGEFDLNPNLDPSMGPAKTDLGTITLYSAIEQIEIDGSGEIDFASNITEIVPIGFVPHITVPAIIDGGPDGVEISGRPPNSSGWE